MIECREWFTFEEWQKIARTQPPERGLGCKIISGSRKVSEEWLFTAFQNTKLGGVQLNVQLMHSQQRQHTVFCRVCLHSSCCRRLCITQNYFDKYKVKKLHKGCQTPRHYLWLRKFLRCRSGKIWEDIVRKHCSFFCYTICSFLNTGHWVKWTTVWLAVIMFMISYSWCHMHFRSCWFSNSQISRFTGFTSLSGV